MFICNHCPYVKSIRERIVRDTLFPIMSRDRQATLAIFEIIKNQPGY